jgi:hypothetical protein
LQDLARRDIVFFLLCPDARRSRESFSHTALIAKLGDHLAYVCHPDALPHPIGQEHRIDITERVICYWREIQFLVR